MERKTTEWLKYNFTRAELAEHAKALAQKNQQLAELDLRQKSLQAAINAEKKAAVEEIARLASYISQGFDYRTIHCDVKYNDPRDGQKTIYRADTVEWVRTVDMDASEIAATKQEPLPFDGVPCSACMPQFYNGLILVNGPKPDCPTCGGSGRQPEATTAAAGTNGAPASTEPTETEPATGEPGAVVDAEFPEVEPEPGPAIASQAEMSRSAKRAAKEGRAN